MITERDDTEKLIRKIARSISLMQEAYYKEFADLEQEVRNLWDTPRNGGFTSMKELRHFSNDPAAKLLRSLTEYTSETISDIELFPYLFRYPTLVRYYKFQLERFLFSG